MCRVVADVEGEQAVEWSEVHVRRAGGRLVGTAGVLHPVGGRQEDRGGNPRNEDEEREARRRRGRQSEQQSGDGHAAEEERTSLAPPRGGDPASPASPGGGQAVLPERDGSVRKRRPRTEEGPRPVFGRVQEAVVHLDMEMAVQGLGHRADEGQCDVDHSIEGAPAEDGDVGVVVLDDADPPQREGQEDDRPDGHPADRAKDHPPRRPQCDRHRGRVGAVSKECPAGRRHGQDLPTLARALPRGATGSAPS